MKLIDTHCHLNTIEPEALAGVLESANACGIEAFIAIGASSGLDSIADAVRISETYRNVWCSIGIHPHDAGDFTTLEALEGYLAHEKVVAIGETGLDFYRDWAPVENQYQLFRNSIALARNCRKPLIVHCRDALEETLEVLRAEGAADVGGVFHCYAGDARYAEQLADCNFLVSFTGNLTFKKATELRETARAIPLTQIMLETDTPYMAPEPFRGKPSEPKHVYQIALRLAELHQCTLDEVARITSDNARTLFKIDF